MEDEEVESLRRVHYRYRFLRKHKTGYTLGKNRLEKWNLANRISKPINNTTSSSAFYFAFFGTFCTLHTLLAFLQGNYTLFLAVQQPRSSSACAACAAVARFYLTLQSCTELLLSGCTPAYKTYVRKGTWTL